MVIQGNDSQKCKKGEPDAPSVCSCRPITTKPPPPTDPICVKSVCP